MATKKEFDIFAHELVPEHRILSEEETKELLRRYRIQISQLPQIKASDPAVVALGAKPGDVLEIKRKSRTAGYYYYYRLVVED
ncbi:DNA-directed RNA polymerase subunit H [Thermococcus celer]|uniref:DNA-directed RNA polymerase subunit Rpo5 n=2 Tax=Thermococcus celer TaxID=2264 RepID=RPO5_THECE|nr:DNA-directed RNA polymerase subunit H [Thermococcus celer]P31815.1 RecName: Full=DNA-directed RNA polymerase subunit Rpo5; AltName: Full=DNA-directed RNA polymerase subunit H [Thermococcus celer]ASI99972.1 DNA-directed RNA polymerase subunit H [Thermococcus celer Vu 13 = JCM 8558]CAA41801.1 DNA-dependent RNA polymerase (subunit H) [Thermococcus celer Vu 13 = JCM 8558]CAA47721.1 Subunit H of DNA-dependent RNA polymerase [Thermococcus celer Vu 13 = JCM 8558]